MYIEHLAVWTRDLEEMRRFYQKYFKAESQGKYFNPKKGFSSYFLSFDSGARLELMHRPDIAIHLDKLTEHTGLAHFSIAVGSSSEVDRMTNLLHTDGYQVVGQPRTTGDGYYESVILDPDGNRIEITI